MKHRFYILLLYCCLLTACGSSTEGTDDDKVNVVATTGMIADLARNIGKDSVTVAALMGPGVDPHLYKTSQSDLAQLQGADLILYNGLHLEGKMGEVLEKLERYKDIAPVAAGIAPTRLLQSSSYQGSYDPHIWFDVELWSSTVDVVLSKLISIDPESKPYYEANAAALHNELLDLHRWVKAQMAIIPEAQRVMVTAHDAFSYFGRAYGLEVRGLQGISTLSEFGLKDRVDLINFIVDRKIKAVFVETSIAEKNIKAIVEGCEQKGHQVVIGGALFSDAMGTEGTTQGTYVGMVKSNVNTIVKALK